MKTSLDPPIPGGKRIQKTGRTSALAKEKIRKAQEEHPYARECLDYLLRYSGDSKYLKRLKWKAKNWPEWIPDKETIVEVNLRATEESRKLRQRLIRQDGLDLPDSLADPEEVF